MYDDKGNSTDPNDPDAIDPTHPNHLHDPRWNYSRAIWAKSHAVEVAVDTGV